MALTLADKGSLLMDGLEQDLFPSQNGLLHYSVNVFFDELVGGDEILLRTYILDEQVVAQKRQRTYILRGAQQNPATVINWLPTSTYRISAQQITQGVGGFKTITWARYTS